MRAAIVAVVAWLLSLAALARGECPVAPADVTATMTIRYDDCWWYSDRIMWAPTVRTYREFTPPGAYCDQLTFGPQLRSDFANMTMFDFTFLWWNANGQGGTAAVGRSYYVGFYSMEPGEADQLLCAQTWVGPFGRTP